MTYTTLVENIVKVNENNLEEKERLVIWVLIEKVKKQMNYRIK